MINLMLNKKYLLTKNILIILTLGVLSTNATISNADERESLEQLKATTTNLIDLLVQEGVLNKDKADAIVKKATQDAAKQVKQAKAKEAADAKNPEAGIAPDEKSVRVQYVPEHIKNEMREEIKKDVMAKLNYKAGTRLGLPSWLDRIAFNGDMRLRYQNDSFAGNNVPINVANNVNRFANTNNTTEDRDRFRVRARFGVDLAINDWLTGGLRFTTGLINTPVTPNQTLGAGQGKLVFGLDRVSLDAKPYSWLAIHGGRFANPFFHTDALWDPDLAFDGAAVSFTPKINDHWSSFSTVGAFPIEEVQSSEVNKAKDKWIYGLQTGIKWKSENKSSARLALAYYNYKNVEGESNAPGLTDKNGTVPAFRQKGNNTFDINRANNATRQITADTIGLVSKFEQINVTGQIDLMIFDPVHVTLTTDYIKNIGFDAKEIFQRTGRLLKEETDAYQVRLDLGYDTFDMGSNIEVKPNDWHTFVGYKYLEADSMLDGFTDSNFQTGGTNAKGWLIGGTYAIDKNAWVGARYFSADTISGPNLGIDVLLVDFSAKF